MSYLSHFTELRNRLLFCFFIFFFSFFFYFYVADFVAKILSLPLYKILENSDQTRMIFTGLPEVFISNLKISFFASFLTTFPILILQFFLFISPALYKKEKKFFLPVFCLIPFLFFLGVLFSYFILIPIVWNFFLSFQTLNTEHFFSIELESRYGEYMKLTMYLLFSGGVSFLFPIILMTLCKINILTVKILKKQRKIFFILILLFSAVLTPPDVISQLVISLPLYLFYEFAILLIIFFEKDNK